MLYPPNPAAVLTQSPLPTIDFYAYTIHIHRIDRSSNPIPSALPSFSLLPTQPPTPTQSPMHTLSAMTIYVLCPPMQSALPT